MSASGNRSRDNTSGGKAISARREDPVPGAAERTDAETRDIGDAAPAEVAPVLTTNDEPASWRQKSLLTCDGGGIRGYGSLVLLNELMIRVGEIEHSYSDVHATSYGPFEKPKGQDHKDTGLQPGAYACEYLPCHYFDYIVGTSTGGLIATMLSRWRMSITECLQQYETFGRAIFRNKRKVSAFGYPRTKHSKKPLIEAITRLTRERTPIARTGQPPVGPEYQIFPSPDDLCRTIVVAIRKGQTTISPDETISRSRASDGPYLFRSYRPDPRTFNVMRPPQHYDVEINYEIWQVCRATTAAKTYFDPLIIGGDKFCDGAAGVNNPTWRAYNEMASLHENDLKIIASFGTGKIEPLSLLPGGRAHRSNPLAAISDAVRSLRTLTQVLTECEETHEQVEGLAHLARNGPGPFDYFRFNVEKDLGKIKMNEWKDRRDDGNGGMCTTIRYIRICAEKELRKPQVQQSLIDLARLLVRRRRERARDDRDRWERFACCTRYKCSNDDCQLDGDFLSFPIRREMRAHLDRVHQVPPDSIEARLEECREPPRWPAGPF